MSPAALLRMADFMTCLIASSSKKIFLPKAQKLRNYVRLPPRLRKQERHPRILWLLLRCEARTKTVSYLLHVSCLPLPLGYISLPHLSVFASSPKPLVYFQQDPDLQNMAFVVSVLAKNTRRFDHVVRVYRIKDV